MKKEFYYPSKDGLTQIHAIEWIPDGDVKAILQIAHGMVEFIDRYDNFANYLSSKGFYVVGNDHLGHGKSIRDDSQLGYFARSKGDLCVIGDMDELRKISQNKYPDVPYFILGHSMGSFLVRQFIERFGEGIKGAIIMGTGYQPTETLSAGIALTAVLRQGRGGHYRNKMLDDMALGSYNKKFEPARTKCDWLTKDEAIVDAYIANPLNQFMFTVNGYYNMFRGIMYCQKKENLEKIPKDLPILVISGEEDPVGEFGKGPKKVAEIYKKTGIKNVTLKLYPEDRHEILNELDKDVVYEDIYNWLISCM